MTKLHSMLFSSFLTKKEIELKEVKDQDLILMNHMRIQILLSPRRRLLTVCLFMTLFCAFNDGTKDDDDNDAYKRGKK